MELFPENHSPYEKDFVTKSNPYAKFSARHFTKKFVSWRICQESGSPHFFDGNSLPNTTLVINVLEIVSKTLKIQYGIRVLYRFFDLYMINCHFY